MSALHLPIQGNRCSSAVLPCKPVGPTRELAGLAFDPLLFALFFFFFCIYSLLLKFSYFTVLRSYPYVLALGTAQVKSG